jgi:hypothetical protein
VRGLGVIAVAALACGHDLAPPADPAPVDPAAPLADYSNIAAADYVGPAACGECHEEKLASWQRGLHRSMNRLVSDGAVRGDFSGAHRYAGGEVRLEPGAMSFWRGGAELRRFRLTRTIGSRYLEEYVGIQIDGPEPAGHPIWSTEVRMPFGYWLSEQTWFHQQYYDSWFQDEYDRAGRLAIDPFQVEATPWAARCAWCHNTFPFEVRLWRDEEVGHGLEQFVRLAPGADRQAIADNLLPIDRLVTVGVSCESCHLGGREHAREGKPIRFDPVGRDLIARPGAPDLEGGRDSPVVVNAICGQCHSTPSPRYPGGAVTRNSTEALDMAGSACDVKCTDCHDPHQSGAGSGAPDDPRHLAGCVRCHDALAAPAAARAHSGHQRATCLDCHMPRVVQGISDVVRSHRIGSPAPAADIAAAAPNACNLCHLDRSIEWTARELSARWGRIVSPAADAYGGPGRPVGEAWLDSGDPQIRVTAAAAYARAGALGRAALPRLIAVLDDPIAYYRMRVLFAIRDIVGRDLTRAEYDPTASPARRRRQQRQLRLTR